MVRNAPHIDSGPEDEPARRAGWREMILLAAVYFLAAKLSLTLAIPPGYATSIWPPSGIALAAAMMFGLRIWPGIWAGAALVNFTVQGSPLVAAMMATGNTLEAVAATVLITRVLRRQRLFSGAEDVFAFVGLSAIAATIAAAIGIGSLYLSGAVTASEFAVNALTWWQGDTTGMIVIAPLALAWAARARQQWNAARITEAAGLGVSLALTTYFVFNGMGGEGLPFPLASITLPFIVWAAIRFGQREVATCILIVSTIAIWHTARGHGPFAAMTDMQMLLLLFAYTGTLVITGLVLSVVMEEREERIAARTLELERTNRALQGEIVERAKREQILRESEARFRFLVEGARDHAMMMLDPNGHIASWNSGAERLTGYTADEIIGKHVARLHPPEEVARHWPEHELAEARDQGRFEDEGWRVRKDGSRFWANVIVWAIRDDKGRLQGFAKVTRDLTARRRIEALQETQRQLNEFLAMLAHELRNPLAPIANALSLMRRKSPGEHDDLQRIIERQVTHLGRIVDDLLDVSRITRGHIMLRREVIEMKETVAQALESTLPLMEARGHTVDFQCGPEEMRVDADPTRIVQVIVNLLTNAAKYTPHGGRISVLVRREEDNAVVRVRDTGIGIAPEVLPRVFDLFVQGDRSLDRSEGGLGIGLTLAQQIAERHQGSIVAHSEGVGRGSEFVLRLPLAAPPKPETLPARSAGGAEPSPARRRILVVDDNIDFASTLKMLLEAIGHEVRAAYDGHAALAEMTDYRPDTLLLDIGLPEMNGYELARRLRASHQGLTIIAISGYGREEDRVLAREAGFDHHLVKPVDASTLATLLGRPRTDGARGKD